ncbi:hypothetical protein HY229_05310 [Candidatus Acetothermia bacterium]|nr:hypothetical protein [Candidatus Acetothermia bacterium]MBI3643502.1 hypothetical protein [Candidatus Acetothermia bacterium]
MADRLIGLADPDFKQFSDDRQWLNSQYEEYKLRYPNEYVAIYKKDLVNHNQSSAKLLTDLKSQLNGSFKNVVIQYINAPVVSSD